MTSEKTPWWQRLKQGLKKTSEQLGGQLRQLVAARKLDQQTLDALEDLLIQADMSVPIAQDLRQSLAKQRLDQDVTDDEVKTILAIDIEKILAPAAVPLVLTKTGSLQVVLMVGVNGSGKTTTISKLTKQWQDQGLSVALAACDTFRAAAVEQLKVWGQRLNVPVYAKETGADAAGLAFEAITQARAAGKDILCIDTAGRLQNKEGLMNELKKIIRVIQNIDPQFPHHTLLVLDATTGQNACQQVSIFQEVAGITGLIMTKLDGTARGGVLVGLAKRFGLPIHAIGVGETADDLQPFVASDFAHSLLGLEK